MLNMAAEGKLEQAIDSVMTTLVTLERANDQMAWRVLQATATVLVAALSDCRAMS
jgi:hypothetical protein